MLKSSAAVRRLEDIKMTDEQIENIMSSLTVDDMIILYALLKFLEQKRKNPVKLISDIVEK